MFSVLFSGAAALLSLVFGIIMVNDGVAHSAFVLGLSTGIWTANFIQELGRKV